MMKWSRMGYRVYYGRGSALFRIIASDPINYLVDVYEPEKISWRMICRADSLTEAVLFAETEDVFV